MTSRRNFLKTAALSGASLVIGFDGLRLLKGANAETNLFEPSNWIRVDADGTVSLTIGKCENGSGRPHVPRNDFGGRARRGLDEHQIGASKAIAWLRS